MVEYGFWDINYETNFSPNIVQFVLKLNKSAEVDYGRNHALSSPEINYRTSYSTFYYHFQNFGIKITMISSEF